MNSNLKRDLIDQIRSVLDDQEGEQQFFGEAEVTATIEVTFRLEEVECELVVPEAVVKDLSTPEKLRLVIEQSGADLEVDEIKTALETRADRLVGNMDAEEMFNHALRNGDYLVTEYEIEDITEICDSDGDEI